MAKGFGHAEVTAWVRFDQILTFIARICPLLLLNPDNLIKTGKGEDARAVGDRGEIDQ
jgi:hypothetical protein